MTVGGVTLDFPAGAVAADVRVTVRTLSTLPVELPALMAGETSTALTAGVVVEPHGTTFAEPVTLSIPARTEGLPAELAAALASVQGGDPGLASEEVEDLGLTLQLGELTEAQAVLQRIRVARLDNEADTSWEILPVIPRLDEKGAFTFPVRRFSVYVVYYDARATDCARCDATHTQMLADLRARFPPVLRDSTTGFVPCLGTMVLSGRQYTRHNLACVCGTGTPRIIKGLPGTLENSSACNGGTCRVNAVTLAPMCSGGCMVPLWDPLSGYADPPTFAQQRPAGMRSVADTFDAPLSDDQWYVSIPETGTGLEVRGGKLDVVNTFPTGEMSGSIQASLTAGSVRVGTEDGMARFTGDLDFTVRFTTAATTEGYVSVQTFDPDNGAPSPMVQVNFGQQGPSQIVLNAQPTGNMATVTLEPGAEHTLRLTYNATSSALSATFTSGTGTPVTVMGESSFRGSYAVALTTLVVARNHSPNDTVVSFLDVTSNLQFPLRPWWRLTGPAFSLSGTQYGTNVETGGAGFCVQRPDSGRVYCAGAAGSEFVFDGTATALSAALTEVTINNTLNRVTIYTSGSQADLQSALSQVNATIRHFSPVFRRQSDGTYQYMRPGGCP